MHYPDNLTHSDKALVDFLVLEFSLSNVAQSVVFKSNCSRLEVNEDSWDGEE